MLNGFELLCFLSIVSCGFMSNPVFFSINLVLSSVVLYFLLMGSVSSWLGMSIVLIFSGGMMVVFLYMTSLCTNYKYRLFLGKFLSLSGVLGGSGLLSCDSKLEEKFSSELSLWEVYMPSNLPLLLFLAGYLLLVLLLCVFVCEKFKGVMRKRHLKNKHGKIF